VIVALVLIAGSLGWVAFKGLTNNLVYFVTPTELLSRGTVGERVRLGGLVDPGSVQHQGRTIQFVVTDGSARMTVVDTGGVPSLFREGQGVVVEGVYGADGAFHADTVLVKHNGVYRPPAPGQTPHSADVQGG
jgi:cytochrome c-type biogenesis protein CcmE